MTLKQNLKSRILPNGRQRRKLPFGIASGILIDLDLQSQMIFFLGLYEVELAKHFRAICGPGAISWDIGASIGYDTLVMAKLTNAPVVAFEPDEGAISQLQHNLCSNPKFSSVVRVIPAFVAASPQGKSVVSIDSVLSAEGLELPDVLKIDVEGAELDVLEGGRRTIEQSHPNIILEVHSRSLEESCLKFLAGYGYDSQIVDRRRWIKESRPIPHNRWIIARRPVSV